MDLTKMYNENKTLKKKIKNLRRTKLRLKNSLNEKIKKLETEISNYTIESNWENIETE